MANLADLLISIDVDINGVGKAEGAAHKLVRTFRKVHDGAEAAVSKIMSVATSVPAMAVGTAAVVSMGAALAGAGVAAGVFGAVAATAQKEISETATKVQDLSDKMDLYGEQAKNAAAAGKDNTKFLKKQADAQAELQARLSMLPKAQRDATLGYMQMKSDWKDFVDENKPATFGVLQRGYGLIGKAVLQLQPFFDIGVRAVERLMDAMDAGVSSGGLLRLAQSAQPALYTLTSIIINVGKALTRTFGKVGAKQGQGMLEWIEGLTERWLVWASATEKDTGINKFLDYVEQNGPTVTTAIKDIATAALAIAKAVTPLAPITLAVAGGLAAIVAAVPADWITAIVAGFLAYGIALKVYALYSVIATAAQWAQNSAFLASPITWLVLGILVLVGVIIYLATKTRFFQTIWEGVWGFLKAVGSWFAGPFADYFTNTWAGIVSDFTSAKNRVVSIINAIKAFVLGWVRAHIAAGAKMIGTINKFIASLRSIPGRVRGALSNIFSPMWNNFKSTLNRIIAGWNRLSFGIPGFSMGPISFPGFNVGTPNIPMLAEGGIATGPMLAGIGEGSEPEAVIPLSRLPELAGRGDTTVVLEIVPGGETEFRRWIKKSIRVKGPFGGTSAAAA